MFILVLFVAIALLAAGLFAVSKGDVVVFSGVLLVLLLTAIMVAPQLPTFVNTIQHVLDAKLPLAVR